jgi:hypothetical protein
VKPGRNHNPVERPDHEQRQQAEWKRRRCELDPRESGDAFSWRTPENLGLGWVQLQSVGLHPGNDIVGTPGKAVSQDRNIGRSAGAVNLSVISISTRKQMTPDAREQNGDIEKKADGTKDQTLRNPKGNWKWK